MMAGAARVRWAVVGLGLSLASWTVALAQVAAADALPKAIFHKGKSFRVPFHVDEADRPRLREIQLWVSDDQGMRWKVIGHAKPDQPSFNFSAPKDGEYWFTVRTQDTQGRLHPSDDKDVTPGLIVVVDTRPPTLTLTPRPRRGSQASIGWEVGDGNLDLSTLLIESQVEGARDWRRVPIRRAARIGVANWDAGTADALKVRASISDRAGNRTQDELTLPEGIAADPGMATQPAEVSEPPPILPASSGARELAPGPDPVVTPDPGVEAEPPQGPSSEEPNPAGDGPTLVVGSPRFPLKYAVDDAGPGGAAVVELWVTRDRGRTWARLGRDADRVSPFPVDLGGEGIFGLTLVARSASGFGDAPPAPGDPPQTVVEVDLSPPVVQVDQPKPVAQGGKVTLPITWRATDAHLGERPVILSYRPDQPGTVWQEITGAIPNTGRYEWAVPANVAPRFLLRVDVQDTLGNRATADSKPIVLDRTRPKSRIIGLDTGAQAGTGPRTRW